jgi:hypothetical protein
MRRFILLGVALLLVITAAPVTAGKGSAGSPTAVCAWLAAEQPELYAFIATKPGACESTIASVGLEGLMAGAFPSGAAAIGNCKFLEANFFVGNPDFGLPDYLGDGRAYPYQFYWFEGMNDPNLYAKNRADCVRILELLHGGYLGG